MNGWYRLSLGDPLLAGEKLDELVLAAAKADIELYLRHEGEHQLHCDLVVYFWAESPSLARDYGASSCGDPGSGLSLLD